MFQQDPSCNSECGRALTPAAPELYDGQGLLNAGVFRRKQRIHAFSIAFLPLVAAWFALAHGIRGGFELWPIALCGILYVMTMLGISVGFHRHLAHRAFHAKPVVRAILIAIGCAAAQGPPLYWVANHRRHHRFSDTEGDPHSPYRFGIGTLRETLGFWHAHMFWMFTHDLTNPLVYAKDLIRDPLITRINKLYWFWVAAGIAIPTVVGALLTRSKEGALSGALWGGGVRLFLSYHFTSCINSVTHMIGHRCFATRDESRNVSWLALPTVGESWHNNHHAFPSSAVLGLRWWQLDPGGWLVNSLKRTSLIWDVHSATSNVRRKEGFSAQLGRERKS